MTGQIISLAEMVIGCYEEGQSSYEDEMQEEVSLLIFFRIGPNFVRPICYFIIYILISVVTKVTLQVHATVLMLKGNVDASEDVPVKTVVF